MSITTKTGDKGWTDLLFERRVRKDTARLEAYGTLDELNSFLGLAKSQVRRKWVKECIHRCQFDIFIVSSEIAVFPQDSKRLEYRVDRPRVRWLEEQIEQLEGKLELEECCFLIPGESRTSALLDVCRCLARRGERLAVGLHHRKALGNALVLTYLNRLSDLLYLLARAEEPKHKKFSARA